MEKEEMSDLKPISIIPEMYSSSHHNTRTRKSQETTTHVNPSKLISFENSKNTHDDHADNYKSNLDHEDYSLTSSEIINFSSSNYKDDSGDSTNRVNPTRSPLQAQEHVMAERKRRENLSQLFISLSKLVPGLNKLDRASLLEDGINYLKALEERVGVLEEMKKNTSNDHDNSCGPEIEARIWEKQVLIKVFMCKKEMELIMSRITGEMDKIHLNVMDIRIMPFGLPALHITILAQMQSEFKGTVKDIVDHLHTLFFNPT